MYDSVDVWVRNWPSVQTSKMTGAATLHVRRNLETHWMPTRDIHADTGNSEMTVYKSWFRDGVAGSLCICISSI